MSHPLKAQYHHKIARWRDLAFLSVFYPIKTQLTAFFHFVCSETVNLNVFSSVTTPPLTFFFQAHILKNTQKLEISIKSNPQKISERGFLRT